MAEVHLITGGQKAGKSRYAHNMVLEHENAKKYFLATARVWDDDFKTRIERHRAERHSSLITVEEEIYLQNHDFTGAVVVLDCITLWLTNIFHDHSYDPVESLEIAKKIWDKFTAGDFTVYAVTNEIGWGVHPVNSASRKFVDLQGSFNQYVAKYAKTVTLMVSGYPLNIKH